MGKTGSDRDFTTLEAALDLAGTRSWREIGLNDIAEALGVPLSQLYGAADKSSLAGQLDAWADLAMSAEAFDAEDTPRERLFDVLMHRYEKLETKRAGVLSLIDWRSSSPQLRTKLLRARNRTAGWALACAGLDHYGPLETRATMLGLAWVVRQTDRAWREDESGDFARTMATLDAELVMAEERLTSLKRFTPGQRRNQGQNAKAAGPDTPEAPSEATPEA